MPAYNFQARFAPLVESGRKQQTIRKTAKGAKPDATAYLYTGQRTAQCRHLGNGVITDVLPIEIGRNGCREPYAWITGPDGVARHVVHDDLDALAVADGFADREELVNWFELAYGLPFYGYLHKWDMRIPADQKKHRRARIKREPMPVRCEICQWRGRRLTPRSAPCPACGSRVEFA